MRSMNINTPADRSGVSVLHGEETQRGRYLHTYRSCVPHFWQRRARRARRTVILAQGLDAQGWVVYSWHGQAGACANRQATQPKHTLVLVGNHIADP